MSLKKTTVNTSKSEGLRKTDKRQCELNSEKRPSRLDLLGSHKRLGGRLQTGPLQYTARVLFFLSESRNPWLQNRIHTSRNTNNLISAETTLGTFHFIIIHK